jgi:hypothetical protein
VNQFCYHFESFLPAFKSFLCHNIGRWLRNNKNTGGVKMTCSISVINTFEMSQKDIQVRRKCWGKTLEESPAYGYGEEERRQVNFSLGEVDGEEDYLEISVDNQQDELGPCKIDIWSNGPVTFNPPAAASVTVIPSKDVETLETNTSLRIPSGLPTWKLEIMRPCEIPREGSQVNVTVGEDEPGGWG